MKIWNRKVSGIPAAIILLISIIYNKILIKSNTLIHGKNLNKLGSNSKLYKNFQYRYPGQISIGDNCIINKNVVFGSEFQDSKLIILDNVNISENVFLDFSGDLTIGRGCTISSNSKIYTHDHGLDPNSIPKKRKTIIGENVWISTNVIILQNVSQIGKNSIIAAGSVLSKDVPENSIFGGIPAKLIGKL